MTSLILLVSLLYFLPTVAAPKHVRGSIFTLNLCLGWTVIVWLACLFWAFTAPREVTQ